MNKSFKEIIIDNILLKQKLINITKETKIKFISDFLYNETFIQMQKFIKKFHNDIFKTREKLEKIDKKELLKIHFILSENLRKLNYRIKNYVDETEFKKLNTREYGEILFNIAQAFQHLKKLVYQLNGFKNECYYSDYIKYSYLKFPFYNKLNLLFDFFGGNGILKQKKAILDYFNQYPKAGDYKGTFYNKDKYIDVMKKHFSIIRDINNIGEVEKTSWILFYY